MAKKFQSYGFTYIQDKDGVNVLTNDKNEAEEEKAVKCFNGYAVFKHNGTTYLMRYPTIQQLTNGMRDEIEAYCGYAPEEGEYGVIAMTFGVVTRSSKEGKELEI
jgi:hypothetical protein